MDGLLSKALEVSGKCNGMEAELLRKAATTRQV